MKFLVFLTVLIPALVANAQQNPDSIGKPIDQAYKGPVHPKILFDEAHPNFHTSTGRYKPFAELLASDGYMVVVNKVKITPLALAGNDVFVCANAFASGPDSITGRLPATLAFTEGECHDLKQWVLNGGSLWLIADHEPAGNAVANLADSFQVNMSKA